VELPELIAQLRRSRGMSQTRLAERLGEVSGRTTVTKDEVSRWERGARRPTSWLPALAEALDVPLPTLERAGAPSFPVPSYPLASLSPDADLADRVAHVVQVPERVDKATVRWLETCLAEHRTAEDSLGAGPLVGIVRSQLDIVAALTDAAGGPLTDELTSLAAQYAQFIAWMAMDLGHRDLANRWYERSHGWAVEVADAGLAATTLSMRAHAAWSVGDPIRCVRLAEAARWHDGHVTPGVQGMASQMAARGHALAGEADPARRKLDEAHELIALASQSPEDEPPWMYFYDDGWFTLQRGMVALHLGEHREAVDLITAGIDTLPAHFRRDRAWYGSCLSRAYAEAGDLDAAAQAAEAIRDDIPVNGYARAELDSTGRIVTRRDRRRGVAFREVLRP